MSEHDPDYELVEDRTPAPANWAAKANEASIRALSANPPADESAFVKEYNPRDYDPVAVTVDVCLFTLREGTLNVLLIRRGGHPYLGHLALPGGFLNAGDQGTSSGETVEEAARRELEEECGADVFNGHLEQLKTYGDPGRDPRMRVVTIAHVAFAPNLPDPTPGSDAADARWWPVEDVLYGEAEDTPVLAFDHATILADAVDRVRAKIEYTTLATQFLAEPFSLSDLRRVYTAVWGVAPELANFRRKVLSTEGFVVPAEQSSMAANGEAGGRPPMLFRRGNATQLQPAMLRPNPCEQ